jgi:hypothetical protein
MGRYLRFLGFKNLFFSSVRDILYCARYAKIKLFNRFPRQAFFGRAYVRGVLIQGVVRYFGMVAHILWHFGTIFVRVMSSLFGLLQRAATTALLLPSRLQYHDASQDSEDRGTKYYSCLHDALQPNPMQFRVHGYGRKS